MATKNNVDGTESTNKVHYVREQKGHSVLFAIFIALPLTAGILPIYWLISKNHYYHL